VSSLQPSPADTSSQRWAWWPLLPLYPYGRRPTLMRELVAGRLWCFEQLHGVWYVAVPIRMTVVKVEGGLMLYAPLPATEEVIGGIRALENAHGPVLSIVLATSSGLEHKLPAAALCRAFPTATFWVSDHQWSFPLNLPSSWLGFPVDRSRILVRDGLPYPEQLDWFPLGPINLGLGVFHELACFDRSTRSLLVTDALVSFSAEPPPVFEVDPTPLLFHARDSGGEPLIDTPLQRTKGWQRILLFANYFRPGAVSIPGLPTLLSDLRRTRERTARNHFGLFPFRWSSDWVSEVYALIQSSPNDCPFIVAPVLEKLVFRRCKDEYVAWLQSLSRLVNAERLISAHYDAPIAVTASQFSELATSIEERLWAPSDGSWTLLASIQNVLTRTGIVPDHEG
jgi:hypothetical protein